MTGSFIIFLCLFVLGIVIHLALSKQPLTKARVLEVILMYYLAIWIGLTGLWGFLGHAFHAAEVARFIGWPAGNPFQFEIAMANLSFGVLGILCLWIRGDFWIATGIGQAVFMWGAAYGHIRQIMLYRNYAPGNAGLILYMDIVIPVIFFGLLIAYRLAERGSATSSASPPA